MKKLMMMLAVVAMAAAAQAAAMSWKSGYFYTPGTDGVFTSTKTAAGSVLGSLYLVDQETYNTFTTGLHADQAAGMAAIYDAAQAGTLGTAAVAGRVSTALRQVNITDPNTYGNGDSVYGVVLYSYNDGSQDWYLANAATYTWESEVDGSVGNLSSKLGGMYDTITGWQTAAAVPEPASVGLLMLGLCALGLKRKRA